MTPHALAAHLLTHGDLLPEVLRPWLPDTIDAGRHLHSTYTAADLLKAVPSAESRFGTVPRAALHHTAKALHQDAPQAPLPLLCLAHLAHHHFTWTRGTARFRTAHFLEWLEDPLRRLLNVPVWLTFQTFDLDEDPQTLSPRDLPEVARGDLFRSALLADLDNPMLDELRRAGLPELHRHRNLSTLPDRVWSQLLLQPALVASNPKPCPLPDISWTQLFRWVRHLRNTLHHNPKAPLQSIHDCPDEALLQDDQNRPDTHEREFLHQLLLQAAESTSATSGRALHAYLLIRSLVITQLVQPHLGHKGLDRFAEDFSKHPWTDKAGDSAPLHGQLVQMVRNGAVRWAELRHGTSRPRQKLTELAEALKRAHHHTDDPTPLSPPPPPSDLRQPGQDRNGRPLPGVRLILHFIKKPDKHKPIDDSPLWSRHRHLRATLRAEAEELHHVLYQHPHRDLIVGLDVAALETAAPIEVFAPYLRALRSTPGLPDRVFTPDHTQTDQAGLGLTIHAGEEFHHLLSGLRTIDESIRFCCMQAGDRIGHGLALGLEPVDWAQRHQGTVYQARLSLLDDLVWAQPRLHAVHAAPRLLHWVERKIAELAEDLYGRPLSPTTLHRAWELRAALPDDPSAFATAPLHRALRADQQRRLYPKGTLPSPACACCTSPFPHTPDGPHCLWRRYWTDPKLFKRGEILEPVTVDEPWTTALRALQDDLLRDISRRGIAIEANPSSNVAIGPIDRYRDHPIFRWHPPGESADAIRPLVVIGSDDPAIFGMELAQEYAALACAAQQRGHSPREILAWLHDLRKTGLQLLFSGAGPQA
jgi:adenosine deaminase